MAGFRLKIEFNTKNLKCRTILAAHWGPAARRPENSFWG